ncbi:MAG: hypothetical protein Q7S34_00455 [bacterium]|nr:hypothetical protein [bacterium]
MKQFFVRLFFLLGLAGCAVPVPSYYITAPAYPVQAVPVEQAYVQPEYVEGYYYPPGYFLGRYCPPLYFCVGHGYYYQPFLSFGYFWYPHGNYWVNTSGFRVSTVVVEARHHGFQGRVHQSAFHHHGQRTGPSQQVTPSNVPRAQPHVSSPQVRPGNAVGKIPQSHQPKINQPPKPRSQMNMVRPLDVNRAPQYRQNNPTIHRQPSKDHSPLGQPSKKSKKESH